MTTIYMVRHAESPYTEGTERTRGLTAEGKKKAQEVTKALMTEGINGIVSSPYSRAILTLEELARILKLEIKIYEDLRERQFAGENVYISDDGFMPALQRSFSEPDFSLPGGESNKECQLRAVAVLETILEQFKGMNIALGTHGNIMTLMMNYFDSNYGFDFLTQTRKPDIYKLQIENHKLKEVTRLKIM
ncbi:histidine phosphatase family protein [Paenibacillus hodogayensis]|uniref:Histidine phosphatase family protein n=1 Tax=Paenibacillus hodogayensis TaxID=279208 RepID=A0ABV5VSK4_9BACL